MSDSQRLEVSTRVPARGQLHQLFRDQDARCGNVEKWDPRQLMSIAARGPGCYVRADGTLVGAGLRDGAELLLAVAHCDGLDRSRVAGAMLHSMRGSGECWPRRTTPLWRPPLSSTAGSPSSATQVVSSFRCANARAS
jgi:hypothetical protein